MQAARFASARRAQQAQLAAPLPATPGLAALPHGPQPFRVFLGNRCLHAPRVDRYPTRY